VQPYAPRPIRFLGLTHHGGWTLKTYSVIHGDRPLDRARFRGGFKLAMDALPEPDPAAGRPGLGILIAHQGLTGDYTVLAWWDHENELPIRLWVRRAADPAWRPAQGGESVCVWDLELIGAERQAWVDTMMSPRGPAPDAYLDRVDARFLAPAR
jgi:hypothetical protein